MASIKRDAVKQTWEETEFPLVCETCLGDNPYVRMTKEPFGKKCQVCETPFTVFAWQAGTKGRVKRVEICQSCARAKNVCQVCIYDLQYGLPVKVRDRVLRETGAADKDTAVPQSAANRSWHKAQQERALEQGVGGGQLATVTGSTAALAHAKLSDMARMQPRYERNLAKLCSFFARGECNRGSHCPFRHEMPRDRNDPMSQQNTKNRFYGTSDPVANKILGRKRRNEEEEENKLSEQDADYEKARATLYLRLKGDAPFPPLTEMDVRDEFYSFGEIVSVNVQADRGQAFVEFTQPEATELAIATTNAAIKNPTNPKLLAGRPLFVAWARAPKRGEGATEAGDSKRNSRDLRGGASSHSTGASSSSSAGPVRPMAPPGGAAVKIPLPPGASASDKKKTTTTSMTHVKMAPEVAAARSAKMEPDYKKARGQAYYPSADPGRLGSKS